MSRALALPVLIAIAFPAFGQATTRTTREAPGTASPADLLPYLAVSLVAFAILVLPVLIALYRDHPSKGGILVVTLFTGCTGVGWVIALAWSLSAIPDRKYR